jgi:hypothetical protein
MDNIKYGSRDFGMCGDVPRKLVTLAEVPFDYRNFFFKDPEYLKYRSKDNTTSAVEEELPIEPPYDLQALIIENLARANSDSMRLQENGYGSISQKIKGIL